MTVIFPEAVKAQGNKSVTVVQTVADAAGGPSLATEINAAGSVNVSCYLFGNFSATSTTNRGSAPRRLCTTEELQEFGTTTHEVSDLSYVYSPQEADTTDANKAKAALVEGSEVWLVERLGLNARTDAIAAGQKVNLHHVRLGPQNRSETGDGEFDQFSIMQSVIYVEPPFYDVAIVA
jgi:hypothetical protein